MANPFVHVELTTGEIEKSKAFYAKLFEGCAPNVVILCAGG